jgi:hypothetical protein
MKLQSDKLASIQLWMQSALLEPGKSNNEELIEHYIAPAAQLTARQSLAIYQRSYYRRLLECMQTQFKALHYTLGKELFEDFAVLYLKRYPSENPGLADLGKRFPQFLEESRPDKESREVWIDFMIAMAQFEVDLYRVFDQKGSEDAPLAKRSSPDASLVLQEGFDVKTYPFEVHRYYHEVSAEKEAVISTEKLTHIAFVRKNYQVRFVSITDMQHKFLVQLKSGSSIETALRSVNVKGMEIENLWRDWRTAWIEEGFFIEK